jgi:hypothetical protein
MAPPVDQLTADGYDLQFGTNVLGVLSSESRNIRILDLHYLCPSHHRTLLFHNTSSPRSPISRKIISRTRRTRRQYLVGRTSLQ